MLRDVRSLDLSSMVQRDSRGRRKRGPIVTSSVLPHHGLCSQCRVRIVLPGAPGWRMSDATEIQFSSQRRVPVPRGPSRSAIASREALSPRFVSRTQRMQRIVNKQMTLLPSLPRYSVLSIQHNTRIVLVRLQGSFRRIILNRISTLYSSRARTPHVTSHRSSHEQQITDIELERFSFWDPAPILLYSYSCARNSSWKKGTRGCYRQVLVFHHSSIILMRPTPIPQGQARVTSR